ncbi:MAG: HupE/UreJ family protein [Gammaproteobacteria bacterium]
MKALAALCALAMLLVSPAAFAHKPSDSYLTITEPDGGNTLDGQWDIALRDLQQAIGIDGNDNGQITWGEVKARQQAITAYAFSRLSVEGLARGDRGVCTPKLRELLFDEHVDGGYAVLRFGAECPLRPQQLVVHYSLLFDVDPNHRGLLNARAPGASQALVLSQDRPSVTVDLAVSGAGSQLRSFLVEGIWHIWKGYDHILFLITLLLPAVLLYRVGRWEARASLRDSLLDVLKVVTAFTLAHSITLTLAVNGLVSLPSRLVESGIAATVLLGSLNNLYPVVRERRWAVAFVFGLIHGLGFASVLGDLGLQGWNLAVALIGFNLGVEVGQLAIVLVLVPTIYALRTSAMYRRAVMPGGAIVIACIAAYWLFLRAFGVSFQ